MSRVHRRLSDLTPGTRILTGLAKSWWPEGQPVSREWATESLRLMAVREVGRDAVTLVGEDGTERSVDLDRDGRLKDGRLGLLWTDALPAGPAEAVKAYASLILAGAETAVLLHVEAVEVGRATCRLVQPRGLLRPHDEPAVHGDLYGEPGTEEAMEAWTGDVSGNAAFWGHPILVDIPTGEGLPVLGRPSVTETAWRPGDLVGAKRFGCRMDGERVVAHLGGALRIGRFTREELGAFLPWGVTETEITVEPGRPNPYGYAAYLGPAGFEEYRDQEEIARVRLEPDEALVLWYRPPGDEPGAGGSAGAGEPRSVDTACAFLGTSGIAFHRQDAVEDFFYGAGIEEGLWVLRNAKPWSHQGYEGDWDSGIEGDWEPATEADLARFGYTLASASEEIAVRSEVDPDPDLAASMIAKAEAAVEEARASAPPM